MELSWGGVCRHYSHLWVRWQGKSLQLLKLTRVVEPGHVEARPPNEDTYRARAHPAPSVGYDYALCTGRNNRADQTVALQTVILLQQSHALTVVPDLGGNVVVALALAGAARNDVNEGGATVVMVSHGFSPLSLTV
jgi:hypothetical protein